MKVPRLIYRDHGADDFGVPYVGLSAIVPPGNDIDDHEVSVRFYPKSVVVGRTWVAGDGHDLSDISCGFTVLWKGTRDEFHWPTVWRHLVKRAVSIEYEGAM